MLKKSWLIMQSSYPYAVERSFVVRIIFSFLLKILNQLSGENYNYSSLNFSIDQLTLLYSELMLFMAYSIDPL